MKKILVIEDTLDVRENLLELLELKGYDVMAAENGEEGLDWIFRFRPDLIICDVRMPKMGGFELLETLRQQDLPYEIPFVFISASAQKADIEKGLSAGAHAYLTKPFTTEELCTQIERLT